MKKFKVSAIGIVALLGGLVFLLAQQNTLPPAKQAIEEQYAQERAAGEQNPAPMDPNTPYPIVSGGGVRTDISDDCDSFHGARVGNCWFGLVDGIETGVFAGVETSEFDPQQGVVIVQGDWVLTPVHAGAVRIVAAQDHLLTLVSATGQYVLTFDASTRTFTSVVIDTAPPVISGMPAAGCTLWPPDHKMVQVATVTAADALSGLDSGSFKVTGVSNEPSDPKDPDIVITPNGSSGFVVQLRAERLGTDTGRFYTLTATANDLVGNAATVTATCTVPHDQGNP